MNYFISVILLVLLLQPDWYREVESKVNHIDDTAVLQDSAQQRDEDGLVTLKDYATQDAQKRVVTYDYGKLMDMEQSVYVKDGFLLGERSHGYTVVIYKRKRQENEPYATLFESYTYFKTESFGLNKSRKVEIYETDNIDALRRELNTKEFSIDTLNSEHYQSLMEQFNRSPIESQD